MPVSVEYSRQASFFKQNLCRYDENNKGACPYTME